MASLMRPTPGAATALFAHRWQRQRSSVPRTLLLAATSGGEAWQQMHVARAQAQLSRAEGDAQDDRRHDRDADRHQERALAALVPPLLVRDERGKRPPIHGCSERRTNGHHQRGQAEAALSVASCSGESSRARAPRFSSSCVSLLAAISGIAVGVVAISQASTTWFGLAPAACATCCRAPRRASVSGPRYWAGMARSGTV